MRDVVLFNFFLQELLQKDLVILDKVKFTFAFPVVCLKKKNSVFRVVGFLSGIFSPDRDDF